MHGDPSPTSGSYYDLTNPLRNQSPWHRLSARTRRIAATVAAVASAAAAVWYAVGTKLALLKPANESLQSSAERAVELADEHPTAAFAVSAAMAVSAVGGFLEAGSHRRERERIADQAVLVTAEVRDGDKSGRRDSNGPRRDTYLHLRNGREGSITNVFVEVAVDRLYVLEDGAHGKARDVVVYTPDADSRFEIRPGDSCTVQLTDRDRHISGDIVAEHEGASPPQPEWVRTLSTARPFPQGTQLEAAGARFHSVVDATVVGYGYTVLGTREKVVVHNPLGRATNAGTQHRRPTVEVNGRAVTNPVQAVLDGF